MNRYYYLIGLFFLSNIVFAQQNFYQSVYFETGKSLIDKKQEQTVINFIKGLDIIQMESLQIYGYCDDTGDESFNKDLSEKRVLAIRQIVVAAGLKSDMIEVIEGKGGVILKEDQSNVDVARSKNRRVDIIAKSKNSKKYAGPIVVDGKNRIFTSIQADHEIGDLVILENIYFEEGKATFTEGSKDELDRVADALRKYKNLEIEIRGHVCCMPDYDTDALDILTREKKLSLNRARVIYKYLLLRNIKESRMYFAGYGNSFPLGKGDDADRRVEFLIVKK
jgi:outer membrane protein OmpA-like peptidoglycan-associated protein